MSTKNTSLKDPEPAACRACRPQAEMVIHHGCQARLGHANQSETGPELSFDQALVVEQNRQGRAGYGGDGIQEAKPRSERKTDESFRLNRPPDASRLDQDKRKKNRIGDKLDPARM